MATRNIIDIDVLHALRRKHEYATMAEVQKGLTRQTYCYATLRQALDRLESDGLILPRKKGIYRNIRISKAGRAELDKKNAA